MPKLLPLVIVGVVVTLLSGCSAAASAGGGGSSGGSAGSSSSPAQGGSAPASVNCSTIKTALAKVVSIPISDGYKHGDGVCTFGIGPNANTSGTALTQLYSSVVNVTYSTSDVDSKFTGAQDSYGGAKPLTGVGTKAGYYDGGNGMPQVFARSGGAFCAVQPFLAAGSDVGLANATTAGRIIEGADVPKLASEFGGVCQTLFG